MLELSRNQRDHLVQWLIIILIVEVFLFFFPLLAWGVFLISGMAFLIGFVLRALGIYPGKYEPLILDLLSGVLALLGAVGCLAARTSALTISLRILTPPFAIVPHFVYIVGKKGLEPSWYRKR